MENTIKFPKERYFSYQIFIRVISGSLFTITVSFRKTKLLMIYSGIMPDIGTFAHMRKRTLATSCLSVSRISLDGFLLYLIHKYFSKICLAQQFP